jgi:hypothetical protein
MIPTLPSLATLSTALSVGAMAGAGLLSTLAGPGVANPSFAKPSVAAGGVALVTPPIELVQSRRVPVVEPVARRREQPTRKRVPARAPPPEQSSEHADEPQETTRPTVEVMRDGGWAGIKPTQASAAVEPPKDEWTEAEVISALRECVRLLAPLGAEVELAQPTKQGQCGTPAPIHLRRIGVTAKVELQPPPLLNCRMAVALHNWLEKTVQPAAREELGEPIQRVVGTYGYSCRNRYNRENDRISEHAFANAIDIGSFVTAKGRTVGVLQDWGPTGRDLKARELAVAASKKALNTATKTIQRVRAAPAKGSIAAHLAQERAERYAANLTRVASRRLAVLGKAQNLGARTAAVGPVTDAGAADMGQPPEKPTPEAAFLRRLHKGACGSFGTVLGPEANEAHRNHFHLDLAPRKRSAVCE